MDQENKEQAIIEELKNKAKCSSAHCQSSGKLSTFNWLKDLPQGPNGTQMVEIRFKNTRKDFYENVNDLPLEEGDIVAVEASPGHDIGTISMVGPLVIRQMKRKLNQPPKDGFKKVYRKARPTDIEKWEEAQALEHQTMIESRQISDNLKLNMKIGDVEYQGDKTKAIFYYIADERVDFRELIKVLADRFKIRVEMKQIGARQEAGRIGGLGSCGRELCCSSHMAKFISVTTTVARYQELSLNPQKLAGQCGKLKCCLNYEVDSYVDARKDFPDTNIRLRFAEGDANHIKTDVYKRLMWYVLNSKEENKAPQIITLSVENANQIIDKNKKGNAESFVDYIVTTAEASTVTTGDFGSGLEDDLTRFDDLEDKVDKKQNRKPNRNKNRNNQNRNNQNQNRNQNKNNRTSQNRNNQNRKNQDDSKDPKRQGSNRENRNKDQKGPRNNQKKARPNKQTPKNETRKFTINKDKKK